MSTKSIDGRCLAKMLSGGAAMLSLHEQELNALNVFPVADGDTGTNMLKTITGGLSYATDTSSDRVSEFSKLFSRGILLSARGNSGVILSQIFAGINDVLKEYDYASVWEFASSYSRGIQKSYAAVQNPTEGTILTVFRESAEYAIRQINEASSLEDFLKLHIDEAKRSLVKTKELLPALAEADVVDSGAAGYLYIAEGMLCALNGEKATYSIKEINNVERIDIERFTRDSVLEYGYCTEFLLRLTTSKTDPDSFEASQLVSELENLGGESIVAYKQDDIIKVHVHTFAPGVTLTKAQEFGEFLSVKIENMNLGHTESESKKKAHAKSFAVVAVAQGDGIAALFEQMGADQIVSGGQTSNPSAEDFITAFKACHAKSIIVLPNNKNIILAAQQAAELYTDSEVHVINTKSIAQGYSALSVITPGINDIPTLISSAEYAKDGVISGEITRAVRDTTVNGRAISKGEYIAIKNGAIVSVADNPENAVLSMLKACDMDLCEIITVFVGADVTDEKRTELTEKLREEYDGYEITFYDGGQAVYDYLVAVE